MLRHKVGTQRHNRKWQKLVLRTVAIFHTEFNTMITISKTYWKYMLEIYDLFTKDRNVFVKKNSYHIRYGAQKFIGIT